METFNKQISHILQDHNIDVDYGLLALVGIHYGLEIEKLIPEESYKALALTKIVERDHFNGKFIWNVPLFESNTTTAWDWVKDWNDRYGKLNPARKGANKDVLARMKVFFAENPEYRKEDIIRATEKYFSSLSSVNYLKDSAAFIFEGAGKNRKSQLLKWCEQTANSNAPTNEVKGQILR